MCLLNSVEPIAEKPGGSLADEDRSVQRRGWREDSEYLARSARINRWLIDISEMRVVQEWTPALSKTENR